MNKIIFHIDFDSYFVSAHRAFNEKYRNKPIAVGRNKRRSIACSVSYELKNKGVKAGWPNFKILQVEPNTIFINPNFDLYVNLSNKIFDFISEKYTKKIEIYSIDECWLDVTDLCNEYNAQELAKQIQYQINKKFKIPISIGISYNKFLAKLSTNLIKPFGILQTDFKDIETRIWPLAIEKYFGIGKSIASKLRKININTIGDLAKVNKNNIDIYNILHSQIDYFIKQAQGLIYENLNCDNNSIKSIGNEFTFEDFDLDDRNEILKIMYDLCQKVSKRAQDKNFVGYVVVVSLRTIKKEWIRKQTTLNQPINDVEQIYQISSKIFNSIYNDEFIRGIGVRLTELVNEFEVFKPQSLFEEKSKNEQEKDKIKLIIENLNNKMKSRVLKTGEEFEKTNHKTSIQLRFLGKDIIKKG